MKSTHIALSLIPVLFFTACAPSLSPQEEAVRLTSNPAALANCEFLGQVEGAERAIGGALLSAAAQDNATARLKQETHKLGGNTVSIATTSTGATGSSIIGEAYRCPASSTP